MATTTNYGWTTPDNTDLVKDGASAIRSLGTSIDTTTKALNPETTTGDIAYRSATANTNTRLGIGSTGQVLTVAAGVPSWASPSATTTSFTLLNAGGTALTGATTITVSGITNRNQLYIVLAGASSVNASSNIQLRINTDTGNNYYPISTRFIGASTYAATNQSAAGTSYAATDKITLGKMSTNAASQSAGYVLLDGCNSGDLVMSSYAVAFTDGGGNSQETYIGGGIYDGTATVTSISLVSTTGNFDNGTLYVYGA